MIWATSSQRGNSTARKKKFSEAGGKRKTQLKFLCIQLQLKRLHKKYSVKKQKLALYYQCFFPLKDQSKTSKHTIKLIQLKFALSTISKSSKSYKQLKNAIKSWITTYLNGRYWGTVDCWYNFLLMITPLLPFILTPQRFG